MRIHEIDTSKFIRWMTTSAIVGIALGIIIGILLTGGSGAKSKQGDSFERATSVASTLGWESLDRHIDSTNSIIRVHELDLLKDSLSKGLKEKYLNSTRFVKNYKTTISESSLVSATKTKSKSEVEVKTKTVEEESKPINRGNHKDGWGNIEIHTATLEQIDKIPYVSKPAAEVVYEHLKENRISSFDELLQLKGVGPKTVERLRENFYIE
jgi:DNA uptake protein ComE-like DNA-binding protein